MSNQLTKLMVAGALVLGGGGYSAYAQASAEQQQTVTCKGVVTDVTGEPMIGATVMVDGTNIGAATNIDGEFSLTNVKVGSTVSVNYIGYKPKTFKVTGSAPVTVVLEDNATALDEVVVTALGMKRDRKALGYAMTELKGDDLNSNVVNPVSALQGKVAGVDINQSDGGLFGSNRIMIRGASTLGKNNQPIYVVDGIILDNANNDKEGDWDANNDDYGNELKNLNPADFETVSVLKGAAATALYGSRGLNGVVVITTKNGKGAKGFGVTFSETLGCDWMISSPKFQNSYGPGFMSGHISYGDSRYDTRQFLTNSDGVPSLIAMNGYRYGWGPKFDGSDVEYYDHTIRPYVAQPDNYRNAYRTGFNTTTNVSIQGGNEKTTFYTSLGYKYAQGIVDNNDFQRFNFLLKASHQISRTVNIEAGVTFADSKPRNAVRNIGESFIDATFPRYYDSRERSTYKSKYGGIANSQYGDIGGYLPGKSLWWKIYEWDYTRKETVVRPNMKLTIEPTDYLRFVAEGSFNYYYTRYEDKRPGDGYMSEGGEYKVGSTTKEQTNFNVNAYFNKTWGDVEFHAMARGEYYHSFAKEYAANTNGGLVVPNGFFISNSKNQASFSDKITGTKTMWSAMGQIGASWKDQVFVDVTGRNDWSSALVYADGHGTFSYFYPSVSASWLINNTFEMPWWVTLGKVRASWAQVGNDTDPYVVNTSYILGSGTHDGTNITTTELNNKWYTQNLKPERKTSIEFGLEWRFVNNRFGFDLAYYKENTKNQIMEIDVPSVSGIKKQVVNAGNIQNQGVELAVNVTPIQTRDWTWDINLTYTHNASKIKELHDNVANYIGLSGSPDYGNYRVGSVAKVGYAYGTIMTDSWTKYDVVTQDEIDNEIEVNHSGLPVLGWYGDKFNYAHYYRSGELKEIGDINPDFLGGLTTGLRYKNWNLNVALDCRFGGYVATYGSHYGTAYGFTEQSMRWRDPEHGGVSYTSMWDNRQYSDGYIPEGIFLTGTEIDRPDGTKYKVTSGQFETGETFAELMAKGIVEPQHSSSWQYVNNQWINPGNRRGVVSDEWFRKLNYIALREISLGYTVPLSFCQKFGAKGLSLVASGRNLGYLLNSLPNKENPEAVRGTNAHEFRIRTFEGTTASFTFTIKATF